VIWQSVRNEFLKHYTHGVICTRVEMSPSFLQKFIDEQRRLRSYHPTDKATGKPVLGLVPKSMNISTPDGKEFTIIIKKTTAAPIGSFKMDSTPLRMNPITGRYE
jgi:hypothetical protein